MGNINPLHVRVDVDEADARKVRIDSKASATPRGSADQKIELAFVRFEPFVIPKKSLTGDSTERVDTRVLQVIYQVKETQHSLFVGQLLDVYIERAKQ